MLFSVGPQGLAIFLIDPGAARFALASGATIFRASGARRSGYQRIHQGCFHHVPFVTTEAARLLY
jgi:hypothetical protein